MSIRNEAIKILKQGTVIPAHPLALDSSRKMDERRQRALTRYYLDAGVGGIAIAVHTTQFEIREPKHGLYEPVLSITAEEIDAYEKKTGKPIVRVAGVCGDVSQAVKEAETAKRLGYDAVLLSPSGLQSLTEDRMIERTKIVANIIPVVGFYLQPAAGGRLLSYDYWKNLCAIENVLAIKVAAFNRYQTIDVVRAVAEVRPDIALYTGNDDAIIYDLITKYKFNVNGKTVEKIFTGGLLGHWAVWTKSAVEMFETVRKAAETDAIPAEILTLAAKVTDCNAVVFDARHGLRGCIPTIHEILRRQGFFEGVWTLNENEVFPPDQTAEIDRMYASYPELSDDEFIKKNLDKWMS